MLLSTTTTYSEEYLRSLNIGAALGNISIVLIPILLVIFIVTPLVLLFISQIKKKKSIAPEVLDANGDYPISNPVLLSNFTRIYKENDNLVFVANEFTETACVSVINFSSKGKMTTVHLDFRQGKTVKVPMDKDSTSLSIIVNGVNGKKVVDEKSLVPSFLNVLLCSILPGLGGVICCVYEGIILAFMLSNEMMQNYSIAGPFVFAVICGLTIPASFFLFKWFKDSLTK